MDVRVKREGCCGTIRVVVSELKQESLEFQQKHKQEKHMEGRRVKKKKLKTNNDGGIVE